jgi:hypothetical protein
MHTTCCTSSSHDAVNNISSKHAVDVDKPDLLHVFVYMLYVINLSYYKRNLIISVM